MNITNAIESAAAVLRDSGIPEDRREAASLLDLCLKKGRTFIIAHPEYELTEAERAEFKRAIGRRAAGEPFHYIAGGREFYGLEFIVTPSVLIPRPETEMAAAAAVEFLNVRGPSEFLEIGVGSGCIAVSVAVNAPQTKAVAADISPDALKIAAQNAERHKVSGRIEFVVSDVYSAIRKGGFDLIVSNPPYVPAADIAGLQVDVRAYEPRIALTDGGSGISIIQRLIDGAPRHLRPKGLILIEIGFGQAEAVMEMFDGSLWKDAETITDIRGIPRMARAVLR